MMLCMKGQIKIVCLLLFMSGLLLLVNELLAEGKQSTSGYCRYRGARAIDGDTFRYRQKSYRIQGYNAPEIGQSGWKKSTRSLQRKLNSGSYKWKPVAKDVYGRTIVKPRKVK